MPSPCLLIGCELSLYREVLKSALRAQRPGIEVRTVPQVELDVTVRSVRPLLVICSAPSAVIEQLVHAWILLHPGEEAHSLVSVAGERRSIPHPTVNELVDIIDEIWPRDPHLLS